LAPHIEKWLYHIEEARFFKHFFLPNPYMSNSNGVCCPRFGMRTLMALMTAAVAASWAYWDGWERWLRYRDQQAFLAEARQFRVGELISRRWRPHFTTSLRPLVSDEGGYDAKGKFSRSVTYCWPEALYVVFMRYEGSYASSVEVFWLPGAPKQYAPQTKRGQFALARRAEQLANPQPGRIWRGIETESQLAYRLDFVELISGDRSEDMGFKYELLHADPPND
jgi:hypothetical protein